MNDPKYSFEQVTYDDLSDVYYELKEFPDHNAAQSSGVNNTEYTMRAPKDNVFYGVDGQLEVELSLVQNVAGDTPFDVGANIALTNPMHSIFTESQVKVDNVRVEEPIQNQHIANIFEGLFESDDYARSINSTSWAIDTTEHADDRPYLLEGYVGEIYAASVAGGGNNLRTPIILAPDLGDGVHELISTDSANGYLNFRDNPNYNSGFRIRKAKTARVNGVATATRFNLSVQLHKINPFFKVNKVYYGSKIELTIKKADINKYLHRATGVTDGKVLIHNIAMWLPIYEPTLKQRTEMMKKLSQKVPTTYLYPFYRIYDYVPGAVNNFNQPIFQSAEQITSVYVCLQSTPAANGQEANNGIFANLGFVSGVLEIGNEKFPPDRYENLEFRAGQTQKFTKPYHNILKIQGKLGNRAQDSGMQLNRHNYPTLFPFLAFDTSTLPPSYFAQGYQVRLKFETANLMTGHTIYIQVNYLKGVQWIFGQQLTEVQK